MGAEEQELTLFTDFVNSSDLKPGAVYFRVLYTDPLDRSGGGDDGRIPAMVPLVFLVRSEGESGEELHFQDAGAHAASVRRDSGIPADEASFHRLTVHHLSSLFTFEHALEELMRCSLRRSESERLAGRAADRTQRTLRFQFDDPALQTRLVQELFREGVTHRSEDGWLLVREVHASRFDLCARRVRDQLFPWYSRTSGTSAALAEQLRTALLDAAFAFALERDDAGAHFILPRVYQGLHEPLFARLLQHTRAQSQLREPILKDVIPLRKGLGPRIRAEVVVGKPAPMSEQAALDWGCPIEIDGEPAGVMTFYGSGAHDSLRNGLQIIKRLRSK
jgi:hypothetical protein